MTEQPGAIPPQQKEEPPEPSKVPVTAAELRAAIEAVLKRKGTRGMAWAESTTKRLDAELQTAVPDPVRRHVWIAMLTQFLKQRSAELATGYKPLFAAAVTAGFDAMHTEPHGIL